MSSVPGPAATTSTYRAIDVCRVCGARELQPVLDLGRIHISGFPAPDEPDTAAIPLEMVICRGACSLVQLRHTTAPDLMYRTYYYRSGTNRTMRDALADVTAAIASIQPLAAGDVVVDIGSNDNTLLKSYRIDGLRRIGFEPSRNIGGDAAADPGIEVVNDYFHARDDLEGRVRALTSIAMFYDLDDPHAFVRDVSRILAPDGVWVIQLAYLPSVLERNGFDGICHEHLAYYSLRSIQHLLSAHAFSIVDAELIDLNEGSIRLYVRRGANLPSSDRLRTLLAEEDAMGLDTLAPYEGFKHRVGAIRDETLSYLREAAAAGRVVHGYGASTKGNTLLQYFGVDRTLVQAIWERQPQKWGLETVKTRIPIVSEEDGRCARPDALLVLPWHFAREFVEREDAYRGAGGKMVIPLPEFRVVGREV